MFMQVPTLNELQALWANADLDAPDGRRDLSQALQAFAHEAFVPVGDEPPPDAPISAITAPVFGPNEALLFLISLFPSQQLLGRRIQPVARDVMRAAARVTKAIDARPPKEYYERASKAARVRR
jgi:hypothetical protein